MFFDCGKKQENHDITRTDTKGTFKNCPEELKPKIEPTIFLL